ncbi:hypothetical protein AB7W34_16200 [Providencia rettgeri]
MDKSRQQFEEEFKRRYSIPLTDSDVFIKEIAWKFWQASRESLEIELPEPFITNETWCYDEDLVNQALVSNGVKIKNG